MTMKPFICNCGAKKGKHRRDHWCDVWDATGPDESIEAWDEGRREEYAEMKRDDERDRARDINAELHNPWKEW